MESQPSVSLRHVIRALKDSYPSCAFWHRTLSFVVTDIVIGTFCGQYIQFRQKMLAVGSSETLVSKYQTTRRHYTNTTIQIFSVINIVTSGDPHYVFIWLNSWGIETLWLSEYCTPPSNEAPSSHLISGGGGGDDKEDTPNRWHRKQPPLLKSRHLMPLRAHARARAHTHTHTHTITDCSLHGYLRRCRVNKLSLCRPTTSQQMHYSDSSLISYSSYMFRRMYVIIRAPYVVCPAELH
jgi:hypothetical protein